VRIECYDFLCGNLNAMISSTNLNAMISSVNFLANLNAMISSVVISSTFLNAMISFADFPFWTATVLLTRQTIKRLLQNLCGWVR